MFLYKNLLFLRRLSSRLPFELYLITEGVGTSHYGLGGDNNREVFTANTQNFSNR